jgi:hypothetical protein
MKDGGPAFPIFPDNGNQFDGMSLRDYFAAKALAALLADKDAEWYPELSDLAEDPEGIWQYNPDTKTVYRTPTAYSINTQHKRYKAVTTWHQRLAREAYRIADAMLAARGN